MASSASPALWWVRRDLRLADNPALRAAIDEGEAVLPLFVLDPVLLGSAGEGPPGLAVRRPACARHRPEGRRRPGAQRRPRPSGGRRDAGGPWLRGRHGTHQRGLRPVRAGPRRTRTAGLGRARDRAPPDRVPVRGRARHPDQRLRRTVPGVQPVPSGLAGAWRARPGARRTRQCGRLAEGRRSGTRGGTRPGAGRPGRGAAGPAGVAGVADSRTPRGCRTTPGCTTSPVRTPPRTCRSPCARATCTRGRCWPTWPRCAARAASRWPGRSPGATSTPTPCSTGPTR